ncbi:MAG: hypothetical protein WB799_18995 [Candidatus Sulfotelmatobacter sp.]
MTFLSDYMGEIVVLVLSAILSVATEKWFPGTDAAQKHFWAAILFIFSVVLGLSVKGNFETNGRLRALASQLNSHDEQAKTEFRIHEVAHLYEQLIGGASDTLKRWGVESQKALEDDLGAGYIPISREYAPTTIADIYQDAKKDIIASNVGSIDYYFDVPAYVAQNKAARDNHVPIVRFFIYSNAPHRGVKLTRKCASEGLKSDSIEDFTKCVSEISSQLGSLCSVVVDFDAHFSRISEARDFLIMDNRFVAETELCSENWAPKRARATETTAEVEKARKYFHGLWGITGDQCTGGGMSDDDVRRYFPRFSGLTGRKGDHLAEAAFHEVMEQVTGPE